MGTVAPEWSADRTGTLETSCQIRTSLHFQERIPHPSPTSPHPRLLGSLRRVLLDYYSSGMDEDFDLSSVRDSDDLVTEEEYTDISDSLDPLPDLTGDLWWQELPPSGGHLQLNPRFNVD